MSSGKAAPALPIATLAATAAARADGRFAIIGRDAQRMHSIDIIRILGCSSLCASEACPYEGTEP
jgi:hypothetical protein